MKLPSTIKNPRKYKKRWRKAIMKNAFKMICQGDRMLFRRLRLRWVKGTGWLMTVKPSCTTE